MPRGRGGARQGTPGTAYGNRTDLNMPISTVPNQEYGKATQQRQAQSAVPMASSPVTTAPAPTAAPAQRAPLPAPGTLPHLEPTQRPNEPVTTGIAYGPGAGPEALGPQPTAISNSLMNAARLGGSDSLSNLASLASTMGL